MTDALPWAFLAASLIGLWFTVQAIRPVALPARRAIPSFFAGWLANELALHHLAWQAIATILFVAAGALRTWPGWLALALVVLQWVLAGGLVRAALRTPGTLDAALGDVLGVEHRSELPTGELGWERPSWRPVVLPIRTSDRRVVRRRNVVYARAHGREFRLDVFLPAAPAPPGGRPAVVYVHGGAWTLGFRDRQGLPLLTELARRGFVGIQPSYRLSPAATFPDHLVDVKRAIAWLRDNADELGVDPGFVAVTGGSAGGHLASLAALTWDRTDLQPGFEDANTSVQACVPFYGAYDPTNELGFQLPDLRDFLARVVLKSFPEEDPDRWRTASPLLNVRADAPPFLVIHGERDSLTSPPEAKAFAARLREAGAPVGFALLPGAQHAFDLFPSIRTAHVVLGVARFLAVCHARHVAAVPRPGRQEASR